MVLLVSSMAIGDIVDEEEAFGEEREVDGEKLRRDDSQWAVRAKQMRGFSLPSGLRE